MRSMTGFGSASGARDGLSVTAEARSVNNRFLKLTLRCPPVLSSREHEIEALVKESVKRGSVTVHMRLSFEETPLAVRLNRSVVRDYQKLFGKLRKETGLTEEPTLELLSQLPGVFGAEEIDSDLNPDRFELVKDTVEKALVKLVRMREREGANLKRDFTGRRKAAASLVRKIKTRAPKVAKANLGRLEERVTQLLAGRGATVEESDLIRELAILSERSDVTEEITRLGSHLDQFGDALKEDGEVGRRLDFLVQEMFREANTIGAKAGDVELSRHCVELKVELDRLKEQVQNVE